MPATKADRPRRSRQMPGAGAHRREETGEGPASLMDQVKGRLASEIDERKQRASAVLQQVAETVRRVAEPISEPPYEALGGYASGAASRIEELARELRQRNVGELADDLRELARRRPGAFVGAGFAAGLLAARFLKSSATKHGDQDHDPATRGR